MKKEEILNQEECDQDLNMVLSTFNSVFNEKSKEISYSDTYNMVYKLCKKGQAQQIMKELKTISIEHFQRLLSSIDKQKYTIGDYLQIFHKVQQCIQRLSQILLYVQSNYMNSLKKEQTTIKEVLNQIFFQVLCSNKDILYRISEIITDQRFNQNQTELQSLIGTINYLDQKQIFLPQYLFEIYNKRMSENYKKLFTEKQAELQITQFLKFGVSKFKKEKEWLQKHFMRVKGKKILEQLTKKIFESSLTQLTKKINQQKSKQLFQTATYDFLALLNQKNQLKLINDFNDWYIQQIRKRLDKIDRTDNSKFLHQFVREYQTITERLAGIKDFNIGYKATFFFENWINQDKIHLPQRLNVLIEKLILKDKFTNQQLSVVSILFKLLKQKDYFEKEFRGASALRSIYSEKKNSECEEVMIGQMAKHCGGDWVQKLRSLRSCLDQSTIVNIPNFSALAFQDAVWPFDKVKSKFEIPAPLLKLSSNYKNLYEEKYKGRSIQWHPIQGYTVLSVRFNGHVQQFKMDTAMTTILLNLQSLNFKSSVGQVLQVSGLLFKQVQTQLLTLKSQKIILIDSTLQPQQISKTAVQLNLNYTPAGPNTSSSLIDLTQQYLQQQFVQKQGNQQLKSQRKMMVQSFIVKIMKSNKVISKKQLFQLITPMIQNRGFKFSQKFVDNCFEILLDKRYIKDLEDGTYSYLAS